MNLVSRYRWVSRVDGADVPFETVARAWIQGGAYVPEVIAAFDADRNGRLDDVELRLDTPQKTELIAARLAALGVGEPVVVGNLDVHPLAHGISTRDRALKDCNACHAEDSRLTDDYVVASYLPGGTTPRPPEGSRVALDGLVAPSAGGGLLLQRDRDASPGSLHVLGHSRQAWTNRLGFLVFLSVLLATTVHGGLRFAFRRKRGHVEHPAGGAGVRVRALRAAVALDHGGERHRAHRHRARGARDREVERDGPVHGGGDPQRLRRSSSS